MAVQGSVITLQDVRQHRIWQFHSICGLAACSLHQLHARGRHGLRWEQLHAWVLSNDLKLCSSELQSVVPWAKPPIRPFELIGARVIYTGQFKVVNIDLHSASAAQTNIWLRR